jgi:lysophospholipase L1-like esterase
VAPTALDAPAGSGRARSPLRTLLALLLSLAVFVVLAEVTLRVYLASHTFYDVEMSRYAEELKIESPNPAIGHVHRPDARAHLMGVDVRINADGLRDDEHRHERDGRRRIAFLGDSLTFGWGVAQDATFAAILQRTLGARAPTEIINFGTGNYNTSQEVALFVDKGLAYHPDEVVVFYFINDAEPTPHKSRWWWLGQLRIATFYWSRVKALWARISPGASFEEYYAGLYRDDQPGWAEAKRAFLRLAAICAERGIALKVVLLPELHVLAPYPFTREHALVGDFLRANGIAVLDLAPRFGGEHDPQSLWVAQDDAHPNARAHRLIADYCLPFLAGGGSEDSHDP